MILLGEHAAVYGRPALVAAAGLRLEVTVEAGGEGVDLRVAATPTGGDDGPAFRETTSWEDVLAATRRSRDAWERYMADPSPESFRALSDSDPGHPGPAHLLRIALGETEGALARVAREPATDPPPPIRLTVRSRIPVGSGFGSSAAAAVAVILAHSTFRGAEPSSEELHHLSLEVERRQHGTPSGVDNATVIRGGVLAARRVEDETSGATVVTEPVPARPERLRRFRIASSGPPAESTGAVVAGVRALRDGRPAEVERTFDRLGELTSALRNELGGPEDRPQEVTELIREAEALLETLGVVPEPTRELIRQIETAGGAAKISGAGSLAGPGAGNLLIHHAEPGTLDELLGRLSTAPAGGGRLTLRTYDVELGAPGARLEGARLESAGPEGAGPEGARREGADAERARLEESS